MKEPIKILLADDEELFRKGIYFLLQREENIEVIFEASNGIEVIKYLQNNEANPDIILMDLKMPEINGVEATKIIHKEFPGIKIIALTSYNTKSFIANMINVGASSYLVKNASPKEMIDTINEVADKGFFYNESVMQVIQDDIISNGKTNKSRFDEEFVTNREKEVLHLICKQLNTNEIAEKLFISPRTVEGHRTSLMLKTETKNIAGLVVYAIQNKLVRLEII
ncbi:MAG: response regulator transcription factor [Flavobacteriaceae bacterium]|nr:response regulator transcription factor [Flavobacteriaceae bacterium]